MTRAVEVRVTGRVQGVSYRAYTELRANRLQLAGWVRNEPDGSVRARFEGPVEAVDAMLAWCHDGPPAARVRDVAVVDVPPDGNVGFTVQG